MLNPGALSSTPIFSARKARSWPSSSFTGSASSVVAKGIVDGSHLHRSFSGGNPASNDMGWVGTVGQASSLSVFARVSATHGRQAGSLSYAAAYSSTSRTARAQSRDANFPKSQHVRVRSVGRARRHIVSGIHVQNPNGSGHHNRPQYNP